MYSQLDKKFVERWMEYSVERLKDVRLVDLKIPMTHNSNTCSFDSMLNSVGKNQIWTVEEQLKNGIRGLDMRYGISGDKFVDKHGAI